MKIKFLLSLCLTLLSIMSVYAQMSDTEKIKAIRSDENWKYIVQTNQLVTKKLISGDLKLEKMAQMSKKELAESLGLSESAFFEMDEKFRVAAKKLQTRFDISGKADCVGCKESEQQKLMSLKNTLEKFKDNPKKMDTYFRAIQTNEQETDEIAGLCCGWAFYACSAVCAGTIGAFPIYLACCAICYKEYCC